jgi:CheY-like chemotaxis protein
VEHLLLNALKFTPAGGRVDVELHPMAPRGALLSIKDSGVGIPKEALPYVFQKFFHADPTLTRAYGGLGLGLAYCQHMIDAHGGRIWVESPGPGQGTTVNVTLACVDGSAEGASPAVPVGQRTVLWVDDNPNMLELVEAGFSSFGTDVNLVTRQRGQEALDEARRHTPHLIVLDIMMPDMNGLEVLARLRADPATRAVPVLVVTGYREAAQEAVERGAFDYFLKPFRIPEMLEKIRDILKLPRSD